MNEQTENEIFSTIINFLKEIFSVIKFILSSLFGEFKNIGGEFFRSRKG
jgi:phage-related protein